MTFQNIYLLTLLLLLGTFANAQVNSPWTQYSQLPYVQNAAFSGIESTTDIKVGFKKQWTSFTGSPRSYFVGINHAIVPGVSSHASDSVTQQMHKLKIGLSGFLAQNTYNYINDTYVDVAVSVHVPISSTYSMSLGIGTNYNRIKADQSGLIARDAQDPYYLDFQNGANTLKYFGLDAGLVFYSDKMYLAYSVQRLSRTRVNNTLDNNEQSDLRHVISMAYTHSISPSWDIQPAMLFRYESALNNLYAFSFKARYAERIWAGLSFRPADSFSLLAGYKINSQLTIAYSYDMSIGNASSVAKGSHEILIGFMPFSKTSRQLIW